MEHVQNEIAAVEQALAEAKDGQIQQLSDLQLAFVGGGGGGETILA